MGTGIGLFWENEIWVTRTFKWEGRSNRNVTNVLKHVRLNQFLGLQNVRIQLPILL